MRLTLALLTFSFCLNCSAQLLKYTAYTVNDGLPSNYIYRCIEDDKGFLWVATDAGIARFDGKRFQVFTIKDGLADDEILDVVKEKNGRIWALCFKAGPSYFDEVQNRFVSAKEDSNLAKIRETTSYRYLFALPNGGVMYYDGGASYVFRDKKLYRYNQSAVIRFLVRENADGTEIRYGHRVVSPALKLSTSMLFQTKNGNIIDSLPLRVNLYDGYCTPAIDNDVLYNYYPYRNEFFIYRNITTKPITFKADSITVPEFCYYYNFTSTWFVIYGNSGKIYVHDKNTLQLKFTMHDKYAPNGLYNDSKGNIWVCTVDKGLLLYKKERFDNVTMPPGFSNTYFISVARKPDGTLLAGNFYAQVLQSKMDSVKINPVDTRIKGIARIRKILISQNKIFTFSEGGINANYKRTLTYPAASLIYAKTAINYNDSIIIFGNVGRLQSINAITEEVRMGLATGKRSTALVKANDGMVYCGSIDGLYKYDYYKGTFSQIDRSNPLLQERITSLCTTADSIIWVATSGSGVVALKNDTMLCHFSEKEGIINNSSRSITAAGPGHVWFGTAAGISVINYSLRNGRIEYTIHNLTVNDGLSSNIINEMVYENDTVYAATANGISIIPANISIPTFDIPVQLIKVSINQRDTVIADKYELQADQKNIHVQLAGIELGGHFKNFQYTLDGSNNWISLNEHILALQLNNGKHTLQVRAVDVNGNISDKILSVQFNIATPFWKSIWFWIVVALVLQAIVFYMVNRWLKKRREEKLAKEIAGVQTAALEQQAFTSLMNPHFMFNALNSIQHYINVQDRKNANRYLSDFASLIRKSFEAAQQSFILLEQEIENIKIYLRLEQMRFNEHFTYEVNIDESIDPEEWMIPTMMLQPFLENALLHGLMHSAIEGHIVIDFKEQDKNLIITITDNGIGIANSQVLKEINNHKSLGMELIQKRIAALSRFGAQSISIHISPAFADARNPGNRITLLIPAGLYQAWLWAQKQ